MNLLYDSFPRLHLDLSNVNVSEVRFELSISIFKNSEKIPNPKKGQLKDALTFLTEGSTEQDGELIDRLQTNTGQKQAAVHQPQAAVTPAGNNRMRRNRNQNYANQFQPTQNTFQPPTNSFQPAQPVQNNFQQFNPPAPTSSFNPPAPTAAFNPPAPAVSTFNPPPPASNFNPPTPASSFNPPAPASSFNPPTLAATFNPPPPAASTFNPPAPATPAFQPAAPSGPIGGQASAPPMGGAGFPPSGPITAQPAPMDSAPPMSAPPMGAPPMGTYGSSYGSYQAPDISHIPTGPAPDRKAMTPGWNDPRNKVL